MALGPSNSPPHFQAAGGRVRPGEQYGFNFESVDYHCHYQGLEVGPYREVNARTNPYESD